MGISSRYVVFVPLLYIYMIYTWSRMLDPNIARELADRMRVELNDAGFILQERNVIVRSFTDVLSS